MGKRVGVGRSAHCLRLRRNRPTGSRGTGRSGRSLSPPGWVGAKLEAIGVEDARISGSAREGQSLVAQAITCFLHGQGIACALKWQAEGCTLTGSDPRHIVRAPQQLGPLLRALRRQAGLTQADVAGQLGVSRQAVSELENRPESATFERLMKLCAVLGVEIALQPRVVSGPDMAPEW